MPLREREFLSMTKTNTQLIIWESISISYQQTGALLFSKKGLFQYSDSRSEGKDYKNYKSTLGSKLLVFKLLINKIKDKNNEFRIFELFFVPGELIVL